VIPLSPVDHVFTGVGAYPIEFAFAYGSPEASPAWRDPEGPE
jgi:hypothetical protein